MHKQIFLVWNMYNNGNPQIYSFKIPCSYRQKHKCCVVTFNHKCIFFSRDLSAGNQTSPSFQPPLTPFHSVTRTHLHSNKERDIDWLQRIPCTNAVLDQAHQISLNKTQNKKAVKIHKPPNFFVKPFYIYAKLDFRGWGCNLHLKSKNTFMKYSVSVFFFYFENDLTQSGKLLSLWH